MRYCETYAALLDMYVDGELAPEEMVRVRAHLETCPGCQAYVDDALAIRAGFPEAEDTMVPESFAADLMKRIRESSVRDEKIAGLKRRSIYRWAGTLAALAACCALVIFIRTGFGGIDGGDSTMMVAAGDSAGAPAGYDMGESEAAEIAPQMALEEPTAGDAEKQPGARAAAGVEDGPADAAGSDTNIGEYRSTLTAAVPAEAAPEAAADAVFSKEIDESREPVLYLNEEEAGNMLNSFTLIREEAGARYYELTSEEYRMLLETLGRQDELPETAEESFLVVVTMRECLE